MAVCLACSVLGGCKDKDKKTYVDLGSDYSVLDSELAEKLEQAATPLDTVITDYKQNSYNMNNHATFDGRYMYYYYPIGYDPNDSWNEQIKQLYKVDLQSGEFIPLCDTPGCTHNINQFPDCINNNGSVYYRCSAVGDEIWCIDGSKIVTETDGSSEVIFENTYCGEFEETYFKETSNAKYSINRFEVDDDYIYIFGPSYTYRVDRKTMKAEKPIVICDHAGFSVLATGTVTGSKMYIVNDLKEMFIVDYNSGEVTKIADKCMQPSIYDDKLYYIRWEEKVEEPNEDDYDDMDELFAAIDEYLAGIVPRFYSAELDGSNEKEILSDVESGYIIKDGKLFYYERNGSEKNVLKSYDLETGETKTIYNDMARCLDIISTDHIDRIFIIGETAKQNEVDYKGDPIPIYTKIVSVRTDGSDLWEVTVDGTDEVLY